MPPDGVNETNVAAMCAVEEGQRFVNGLDLDAEDVSCLLTCLSPLRSESDGVENDFAHPNMSTVEREDTVVETTVSRDKTTRRDGSELSRSVCSVISLPSEANRKSTQRRSDSNKAREERRQELLRLRLTAEQLERELATLRQQHGPPSVLVARRQPRRGPDETTGSGKCVVHGPWETIAAHQRKERQRAENENMRLRVELDQQLQFAHRLERLVHQNLRQRTMGACGLASNAHPFPNSSRFNDRAVYECLMRAMEHRYHNIDAIFERLGIRDMEHSHHGTRVNQHEYGMEVEIFRNEVLPVSMEIASTVAWRDYAQNMARIPYRSYYQRVREVVFTNEDILLENIGFKLHFNGKSAHFRVQQVLRRFVERDRVAIMWSSKLHTVEYSGRPVEGTVFLRNGCMLFQRPRTLDPTQFSTFKMSNALVPMVDGVYVHPDTTTTTKELSEVLLGEGTASAAFTHQIIENMLLSVVMTT